MRNDAKKKLLDRLRRAEGQVRAIRRMVEEEAYCIDTLTQLAAVRGALDRVGAIILEEHLESCVVHAFEAGDERERKTKVDELLDVFGRMTGRAR